MSILKKIKNVVQDVAPVVLPMVINAVAPGLGTAASYALGAGIGTLIQGGDAEDALKNAAIGGGIGSLQAGIMGGSGSFGKNIAADFKQTGTFLGDPLSSTNYAPFAGGSFGQTPEIGTNITDPGVREAIETTNRMNQFTPPDVTLEEPSFLKGPFNQSYTDAELMGSSEFEALRGKGLSADKALESLKGTYTPSFMQKYGLPIAGGIGALSLMGSSEEEEGDDYYMTGSELVDMDPEKYRIFSQGITRGKMPTLQDVYVPYTKRYEEGGIVSVPNKYKGFSKLPEAVQRNIDPELAQKYRAGGNVEFFPRRNGGIGPGEGSGTKDDVPAMLMDGEFVMTRNAVKAAGGGNIKKGIDNMYGLMRNLEARA